MTCTATDSSGNSASASFTVHVNGATEQLDDLLGEAGASAAGTSLSSKLQAAGAALNAGNLVAACNTLDAFIHETQAQSGKALTVEQATRLTASASRIRAVLSC